jgi:hypothetical protein
MILLKLFYRLQFLEHRPLRRTLQDSVRYSSYIELRQLADSKYICRFDSPRLHRDYKQDTPTGIREYNNPILSPTESVLIRSICVIRVPI